MIVAHGFESAGIHGAVAKKLVDSSVVLAGTGMRDDIDLAAAGAAHVGGVAAGFHLKFLHGIGRRAEVLRVEGGIGVGGAVEEEIVRVRTGAANHYSGPLARAPVERIGGARLGCESNVSAGNGEHKVNQHAAVQGQIANGCGFDDFADAGV